jgi:cell division protein ZapA
MTVEDKRKHRYSIKIMGEELVVVGDISDEYVKKLAAYVNNIGNDILKTYPRLPRQRIMGLIVMNLADEYFKLRNEHIKLKREYTGEEVE